eukprot:g5133.t1
MPDLAIIGLSAAVEVALALVVLYVAAYRRWPGYVAKNCGLLVYTALAGILVNLAVAMRYGWWGVMTDAPGPPVGCIEEAWLLWSGVGGFFACAFLRVYRCHNVLVLTDGFMCPVLLQLAALLLPFLVPPAFFVTHTGEVAFDEDTHECERQSDKPELFAFGVTVVLVAATAALTCSLRWVKLQAPEEVRAAVAISVAVILAVVAVPLLHEGLDEDPDERRRAMLVASSLTTFAVAAAPLVGPLKGFVLAKDERLKASTDFGFSRSRQPGDLQKNCQDRMQVNALVSSPGGRYIPESSAMAWFFRDSLDRESERDPFLLQAATMRILKKYVREGAPLSIPLSPSCREDMLTSNVSSAVIFDRARQEVMEKLGGGRITFCASPTSTVASGESALASSRTSFDRGDGVGATDTHPKPVVIRPALDAKNAWRNAGGAAVSGAGGGQIERHGLGVLCGGSADLSAAFGLRPGAVHQGSRVEDGPPRDKRRGLVIGRGGSGIGKGGSPAGAHDTCSFDPFEDTWSPRRDELSAVELPDVDRSDSLDDLDPFRGLQGTLDFNFADSIASIPGLAESMRMAGNRKLGFAARYRGGRNKKNSEVSISVPGSSEEESQGEGSEDGGGESHVINPLFVGELRQAVARRRKNSA